MCTTRRVVSAALTLLALTAPRALARPSIPDATDKAFLDKILTAHNGYRAKHGVRPLVMDKTLVAYAKKRAALISTMDGLSHGHAGLKDYGENLYWGGTTGAGPSGAAAAETSSAAQVVSP